MMGTFATELAKSKIATPEERFRASVNGDIQAVDGILRITHIRVDYILKLAPDKRREAQACFDRYLPHCPAAQSVIGCIAIDHRLEMQDS